MIIVTLYARDLCQDHVHDRLHGIFETEGVKICNHLVLRYEMIVIVIEKLPFVYWLIDHSSSTIEEYSLLV